MSEPRFHLQEPSTADKALQDWIGFILCVGAVAISIYVGFWPVALGWIAYNWTTIWQVFVVLTLLAIVSKR